MVRNLPADAGDVRDVGSIPAWGRSPGGGLGNPFQFSCLENPMDRGAWRAMVHNLAKGRTQLKRLRRNNSNNNESSAVCLEACGIGPRVLSCVRLFVTPWTVAPVPLSMGFPRQEYWSGLPFPPSGNLPHSGIEPAFPALQVDSLPVSHREALRACLKSGNWRPLLNLHPLY